MESGGVLAARPPGRPTRSGRAQTRGSAPGRGGGKNRPHACLREAEALSGREPSVSGFPLAGSSLGRERRAPGAGLRERLLLPHVAFSVLLEIVSGVHIHSQIRVCISYF